ncbi:hypothetical protein [uncultured Ruegeria sp.]|uniref:hypothetical protein n=1 Tax=uncultured Ruegeria sp. TaxID=259304 RepID=UPI0026127FFB|nr:hypothetical protein [uncultured Ruegeria sp.]
MTDQRVCANDSVHPEVFLADHEDLATCEQRKQAFCLWFDLPDPGLRVDEDGGILIDDVFLTWCEEEGISIDWLACGDPKGMATAFRERQQGRNKMEPILAKLDEDEVNMLTFAMNAHVKNHVPLDQAMETFEKSLKEYRKETSAA